MPLQPLRQPTRPMRCALVAWLAFVLVAVNLLGTVHRVAHAGNFGLLGASSGEQRIRGVERSLFDAHSDLGSCERYDQLSVGAALPCVASTPVLPAPQRHFAPLVERAAPTLRRAAAQARGPPLAV